MFVARPSGVLVNSRIVGKVLIDKTGSNNKNAICLRTSFL